MANYRDVKGASVVALAEGKKIGQIEDLIVDPEARRVRWLRVSTGATGLFHGPTSGWVPVTAVHSVGEHAVTINGQADVRKSEDAPEATALAKSGRVLLGKKVITEDGTVLGEAKDFTFTPETFRLDSIIVTQGSGFSPQTSQIDAGNLMTIGEDLVVVRKGTQVDLASPKAGSEAKPHTSEMNDRAKTQAAPAPADYPAGAADTTYSPGNRPPVGAGGTRTYDAGDAAETTYGGTDREMRG